MPKADVMVVVEKKVTKSPRKAVTIAATGTSFTFTFEGRGVITRYLLEAPDVASSTTFTLSLVDENSITIFTGSAHAENANHSVPCDVEIDGRYTVTLTLNQAAGGTGGTAYVTFWLSPYSGNSRLLDWFDQAVKQASSPTFAGIVIANGGTIGQAAGPLLTFNDTTNLLSLTGANLVIGKTNQGALETGFAMHVYSSGNIELAVDGAGQSGISLFDRGATTNSKECRILNNDDFLAFQVINDIRTAIVRTPMVVDLINSRIGVNDVAPGEDLDVTGNINATGVLKIDDVQVVSNRVIDARCDDTINSGDATTDGVIDALRDAMIAHGLIAAA